MGGPIGLAAKKLFEDLKVAFLFLEEFGERLAPAGEGDHFDFLPSWAGWSRRRGLKPTLRGWELSAAFYGRVISGRRCCCGLLAGGRAS
jgi:hypothetical protein